MCLINVGSLEHPGKIFYEHLITLTFYRHWTSEFAVVATVPLTAIG